MEEPGRTLRSYVPRVHWFIVGTGRGVVRATGGGANLPKAIDRPSDALPSVDRLVPSDWLTCPVSSIGSKKPWKASAVHGGIAGDKGTCMSCFRSVGCRRELATQTGAPDQMTRVGFSLSPIAWTAFLLRCRNRSRASYDEIKHRDSLVGCGRCHVPRGVPSSLARKKRGRVVFSLARARGWDSIVNTHLSP